MTETGGAATASAREALLGSRANTGVAGKKKANRDRLALGYWWRWAESNRRPKALHPRHYMLSAPLGLAPGQHDAPSASRSQPVAS